jgi:hypothetical protein
MASLPEYHAFDIWMGSTFRLHLDLYTDAHKTIKRNLTGSTSLFKVVDSNDSILMTLTSGSGITLGDTLGTIDLVISSTVTATLPWTQARYELSITGPAGGDTDVLIWGRLNTKGL